MDFPSHKDFRVTEQGPRSIHFRQYRFFIIHFREAEEKCPHFAVPSFIVRVRDAFMLVQMGDRGPVDMHVCDEARVAVEDLSQDR